jgi:hypothetical protein
MEGLQLTVVPLCLLLVDIERLCDLIDRESIQADDVLKSRERSATKR